MVYLAGCYKMPGSKNPGESIILKELATTMWGIAIYISPRRRIMTTRTTDR
jgi:hypothetical protein